MSTNKQSPLRPRLEAPELVGGDQKRLPSFGEWLKRKRISKGLTRSALADLAKVKGETLSNWEKGIVVPRFGSADKIADALGIDREVVYDLLAASELVEERSKMRRHSEAAEPVSEVRVEPLRNEQTDTDSYSAR